MTARELHTAIRSLYPDADPTKHYTIRDDGDGYYISQWLLDGPLPEVCLMEMKTPLIRWHEECLKALERTATMFDLLAMMRRIGGVVERDLAAIPDGEIVPGTTWTKEQFLLMMLLWQKALAFLDGEIIEGGDKIVDIISQYA